MNNLGEQIKAKRIEKGLTIEELSKKTLLSIAIIKDIEEGAFDRYEGDEVYVKKYLSKISDALDMDNNQVTQTYIALTREIKEEELEEAQKALEEEKPKQKEKPDKKNYIKKHSVYEDKSHLQIIRVLIVVVVLALVVVCVYFGITSIKKKDTSYVQSSDKVTGEVSKKSNTTNNTKKEETKKTDTEIKTENTGNLSYKVTIPSGVETFTFKAKFNSRTYTRFLVNDASVATIPAQIYPINGELSYEVKVSEFTNLSLHISNNQGTKYYINDKEITLASTDINSGVTDFKLVKAQAE